MRMRVMSQYEQIEIVKWMRRLSGSNSAERDRSRMSDIWDSPLWQERVIESGFLSADSPLNVVISLSSDGVNPFGKRSQYIQCVAHYGNDSELSP
jgi:hypothetical protein